MDRPIISICIPTYNRAPLLKECLESIGRQFSNPAIKDKVDVFILDNQSSDETEKIAKEFLNLFPNIVYIRDEEKRGLVPGIIKAASLADGEYIWIFSDDDLQTADSLQTSLEFIEHNRPEVIISNLVGFNHLSPRKQMNLLNINSDQILKDRRELFAFLEKKIKKNSLDYYITLCSNWLIAKNIFVNNCPIFSEFHGELDLFPLPSLIFYANEDYRFGIIAKEIVLNRGDNESWGSKKQIKHFFYRRQLWQDFYQKIISHNQEFLPKKFAAKIRRKNILDLGGLFKIMTVKYLRKIKIYERIRGLIKD